MVLRFNWCDQNVLWISGQTGSQLPHKTWVSLDANREPAAEWKSRDKKPEHLPKESVYFWPKIEKKTFSTLRSLLMKQIVNNTVGWWPETTLENMTSFQRALASPFEETSPKFYTCIYRWKGAETNCGIAHIISGNLLMTCYICQIYMYLF